MDRVPVEPMRVDRERWDSGRTEAFSDGVFAIAVTLLVLDLGVPPSGLADLPRAILHEWPSYLGYATSFLTIGGLWLAHHSLFRRLRFANSTVVRINLVLLMAVAFLPYPTRLVAEAIRNDSAEPAAVIFYGLSLLVISLLYSALWTAVARDRKLLLPEVGDEEVRAIAIATSPTIGLYAAIIVLAIVAPKIAAFGFLGIAVAAILRVRGSREDLADSPDVSV
jgi:uncharacterized membrane protein